VARNALQTTLIFLSLVVLAVVTTIALLYLQLRTDEVSSVVAEGATVRTLLVAHEDNEPFFTFMLFQNTETGRTAILDIPESIGGVLRPLGRVDQITALFDAEEPSTYRDQIEALTGVETTLMLVFTREELADFIDLLGGIEMFIINDYRPADRADPVVPAGNVRLDGYTAIEYLTTVDEIETDLERVGRRQSFVQAMLREIVREADFLQHPDVVALYRSFVETDADRRAVPSLFAALAETDPERLVRRRVQGTVRQVDVGGVQRALLFPHFEGQWLKQSVQQVEATLATLEEDTTEQLSVSIEILNGTATSGLARRTSDLYDNFGFEVRRFGNAGDGLVEHTMVVDRRGFGNLAERVAEVIGAQRIVSEVVPDSDVDVTLILGRDFDGSIVRTE
jgi:anionic cell wall polymer biosynthesis LytR-Cps2A-Psr (LCP) family protein